MAVLICVPREFGALVEEMPREITRTDGLKLARPGTGLVQGKTGMGFEPMEPSGS